MKLRADLNALVEALAAQGPRLVTLDELAESLGAVAVSFEEIDWLFTCLEQRGLTVGESIPAASTHLGEVLRVARELRSELGRTPTSSEIAERAALSVDEVRRALLAVTILQR